MTEKDWKDFISWVLGLVVAILITGFVEGL